jgi:DNA transformation protein
VDPDTIQELFAVFGLVKVHRMFGGAGLYADCVMFGLVSDGQIYLKADKATAKVFEREGCGPFEYRTKAGRRAVMSYWRLPDRLYDEPGELAEWAPGRHRGNNRCARSVPALSRSCAGWRLPDENRHAPEMLAGPALHQFFGHCCAADVVGDCDGRV